VRSFLIILFCLFGLFITAQNDLGLLSIDGTVFKVYINDSAVNKTAEASVLMKGIRKDTLKIKVELDNKLTSVQTLYFLEQGKPAKNTEFDYIVEVKNNQLKLVYSGTKKIVKLPDPLVPVKPVVDTSAKYRNNVLGHYLELKNGNAIYFNNIPNAGACKNPMPQSYINYLKILMSKTQVEDDKFVIAENTTRNNCVSVSQLINILSYIEYEIEKLKLIKLSYFHITDLNNRKNLDSTFKLESSKRELLSFFSKAEEYKEKTGVACTVAAKENEISDLYAKLSIYNNDTEKFTVLKKTYADFCYSVNQVKLLTGLFIHDREKIDAAKLLYFYCTEKDNFLNIADVFSYNSSIADLKEFVAKQKN